MWPGTSHHGRANLLFCDGHVETARQTNWVAATDTARRRWNNDHEPHPEKWERP
jgi:prepilin-type processing-associated H-X9-DG protein